MTVMAGRQAIMGIFRAEGVDHIFGNPGTTELGFMDILQDYPDIRYIVCLHESIALGAAQMYANASGKTGVVNLHVAPGLGNALGALYNAAIGKMPLIVTAGQQDSRMVVREPVLSYDLVAMAKPLAKWSVQLQHVDEIPTIFHRAFKVAQDPPRGPVFIALPGNIIDAEADLQLVSPTVSFRKNRPDPEGVQAAAALLAKAQQPAIICGDGVQAAQAQDELVHMAELLGANVWNTLFTGALGFPNMHPHFRGALPAEHSAIRQTLSGTDVVLAVGVDLFDEVFYSEGPALPDGCSLVQIDNSSWEIGKNMPADVGLLADPKLALQEVAEVVVPQLDDATQRAAAQRRETMQTQKAQERARLGQRADCPASPVCPVERMLAGKCGDLQRSDHSGNRHDPHHSLGAKPPLWQSRWRHWTRIARCDWRQIGPSGSPGDRDGWRWVSDVHHSKPMERSAPQDSGDLYHLEQPELPRAEIQHESLSSTARYPIGAALSVHGFRRPTAGLRPDCSGHGRGQPARLTARRYRGSGASGPSSQRAVLTGSSDGRLRPGTIARVIESQADGLTQRGYDFLKGNHLVALGR